MNYKEIFVFKESVDEKEKSIDIDYFENFKLNNYVKYEHKLVKDFYLSFFIYQFLFEIDILEIDLFLDYHLKHSKNPDFFQKVLKLKVLPEIKEIIENATISFGVGGSPNGKHLGDGFYEDEVFIRNYKYTNFEMSKNVGGPTYTAKYIERVKIIEEIVIQQNISSQKDKVKWVAGPGALGYIIRELVDLGYIEADMYKGEVNSSELARKLLEAFNLDEHVSPASLSKSLNPNSKKYISIKKKFDHKKFSIPSYIYL
jgi:hypothetical protein